MELPRWGSFEGWSRLVPHALVWAGLPDPMGTRLELEKMADASKNAIAALLEGLSKLAGGSAITVAAALRALYPTPGREPRPPEPEFHAELREAIESLVP